ncbi:autotransporter family protein [Bartonella sp. B17]
MTKVFKKRVHLCTFTTVVLFFLQSGVGVVSGAEGYQYDDGENSYSRYDFSESSGRDYFSDGGEGYYSSEDENAILGHYASEKGDALYETPYGSFNNSPSFRRNNTFSNISYAPGYTVIGGDGYDDSAIPSADSLTWYDGIPDGVPFNGGVSIPNNNLYSGGGAVHCTSNDNLCVRIMHNPADHVDSSPYNRATLSRENNHITLPYHITVENKDQGSTVVYGDGMKIVMSVKDSADDELEPYWKSNYLCNNCGDNTKIDNETLMITKENVGKTGFSHVAITVKGGEGTQGEVTKAKITGNNVKIASEVSETPYTYAVSATQDGEVDLTNLTVKNAKIAFYANNNGKIKVNHVNVEESNAAIKAINKGLVALYNVKINTSGKNEKVNISSAYNSEVIVNSGTINFMDSYGFYSVRDGKIALSDVTITGESQEKNLNNYAIFFLDKGGIIDANKVIVNANNMHGIMLENTQNDPNSVPSREDLLGDDAMSRINIRNSSFKVHGDGSYGIYFRGEKQWDRRENAKILEKEHSLRSLDSVTLWNTTFLVDDIAIRSINAAYGIVNLSQSTVVSENLLLKAEGGSLIEILAENSSLKGSVHANDDSVVKFYLDEDSKWILRSKPNSIDDSSISFVSLINGSAIDFEKPKSTQDHFYQTLRIGTGKGVVYKTDDKAQIYLNTYLASDGSHDNRQTDRVLIHGSVEGKTTVHVRAVSENSEKYAKNNKDSGGISLIQVSGMAKENSFELDGGYVALEGSPYAYRLHAYYGLGSDLEGNFAQRLVEGEGKFWNFYLKSAYVKPKPDQPEFKPEAEKPDSDLGVKVVVPQVPTYLLLPNALFHSGLVDISNLSKRLEAMRISFEEPSKSGEGSAFFVRGYGGNYHYSSDLPVFKYGYGGDLDYNAVEAGVLFKAIESAYGTTSFGVIGTYGKLSLQPVDVEQSKKSAFEKWMLTAYGSMQHDGGAYVNGLVSYGLFQGDVFTRARGKTATLKGHPLSVSVIAGKALMVGSSGLVFDPQVQVVYQHLQFNHAHDIDNFAIKLGNLEQWVTRVGGRLTKTLSAKEDARVLSFYGKLHFAHGFGDNQTVHFKDAFQLGAFGSSLEAGLGFHAQLLPKLTLNGDLMYQHKLTKAGFSGATFSGGLRYQF